MNRIARSLTQPNSPQLFIPAAQTIASRRGGPTLLLLQLSPPKPPRITSFATRPVPTLKPRMESPDPPPPTAEDFVHILNPAADPLSESIVNVEDELRREEEEARESGTDAVPPVSHAGDVEYSSGDAGAESRRGDVLPEELSRSVVHLTCESSSSETGTCDVYLVGTAHVSIDSCKEVQAVIDYLQPEVVFLELCASRLAVLTPQNLKIPTMAVMIEMYKKKHNMFGILYSWFLAKVASKLEVFPGSEFRVAYEEARKYGAKVILGDRPVEITLRRTWAKMPLWHKTKLVFSLFFQSFFLPSAEGLNKMLKEMDDVDMLTLVIQEMNKEFPTLMETLVHERDQYMSYKLYGIAGEYTSVVAVVGKGHLQGIEKHWKQPVKMVDLMEMPTEKPSFSAMKVFASVGVGIAGVAIVSGLYLARKK